LARYNIDIAALSETRLSEEDQLTERGAGYTFFWKGKAEGVKREGGVGFAVRTEIINLLEQPHGISVRIMFLRAPLSCGRYMTVISVYAPTLVSSQESIMGFYQDQQDCVKAIPKADKILML
jgi:exonuclease III